MNPIVLGPNQIRRFYRGGAAIARFRGVPGEGDHAPEDWVGSATSVFGEERLGRSVLPDGRTATEAFAADPEAFFGPRHADRFGADPGLLVKLLDAGERLPVHCHPDREFARRHLNCPYGKTEAWVILEIRSSDAGVFLGFGHDVELGTLATWVGGQDTSAVLAAMNRIPVAVGDAVLVPAGVPHAIGEGVFLVELQEPTDLSVLLEWKGFDIDVARDGQLGLGFDQTLRCADRSAWNERRLARLHAPRPDGRGVRPGVDALFPHEADPFFRAERIRTRDAALLPASFSILVTTEGRGRLEYDGGALDVRRGTTVLVPFAMGDCRLVATRDAVEGVRCMPPDTGAPEVSTPILR